MAEWKFIMFFAIFMAFLTFIMSLPGFPSQYKFVNAFDFIWLTGGIIGVAGACAISTGIPCAGALAVWGFLGVFNYIIVSVEWVKLLVFTPIAVTLIFIIARLGRG